jgi:hypothetical protein
MIELRLHRELYLEEALAQAIDLYREHAHIERQSTEEVFLVRVSSDTLDEREVADELANYVLGATVELSQKR